jgi:hypothetical protein
MSTPQAIPDNAKGPAVALYPSVALLSAASLGLEVVLMRLFSIIQWHHYASMVISLALLGIGAGGIFVRLVRDRLVRRFVPAFSGLCLLFGVSAIAVPIAARALSFNPLEVMWDPLQWPILAGTYIVLAVPFFCFGSGISLALTAWGGSIRRIYAFDLAGAGLGATGAALALFRFMPGDILRMIAVCGFLASGLAAAQSRRPIRWGLVLVACGAALALLLPRSWTAARPSQYKALSLASQRSGVTVLQERPGLHGVMTLLASSRIPFRVAPGLSPYCESEIPEQVMAFVNGEQYGALPRRGTVTESPAFWECLPTHLGYLLLDRPRVLVGGAVRGLGVYEACGHEVARVTGLERSRALLDLLRDPFTANPEQNGPSLSLRTGSLRTHLARTDRRYDLMQMFAPCSGGAALGASSIEEGFTCTVQGMASAYGSLLQGGLLMMTHRLARPPNTGLKLAATVRRVLKEQGVEQAKRHVSLIATPGTFTLLLKKGEFGSVERDRIRTFCSRQGFEVLYPGSGGKKGSTLQRGTKALLGENPQAFLRDYPYHIRPATDGSPYFSRFFRWRSLPELFRLRGRGGASLIQWGYLILLATLLQAAIAGGALILLPLVALRRSGEPWRHKGKAVLAFIGLGLGFLFAEIAFIQRLSLFLGDPVLAASVTLASFLVFAGAGSWLSRFFGPGRAIAGACLAIPVLAATLLHPALMPLGLQLPWKLLLSVAVCAVPAFFMGMPLPLGLEMVNRQAPRWIPWAWGINGCASVLAPVLATLIGVHYGFAALLTAVCLLYGAVWLLFRAMRERPFSRVN